MILRDILRVKGSLVHTIGPDATLDDVLQKLVRLNIGSLVVCELDTEIVVGIITERDILRMQAAHTAPLGQLGTREAMSSDLVTADPDDSVEHAKGLMTHHRVRHLPIVSERRVVGLISIGDIVKSEHDEMLAENHYLRSYLQGNSAAAMML